MDAIDYIDAFAAMKQDADGRARPCLGFDEDLTTATTGGHRLLEQFAIGASCCNGEHLDGDIGILGTGREEGGTLGTESRWIGRILLITADDFHTILKESCSAYMEVGVGGIAAAGGFDGKGKQMLLLGCQFLRLTDLNDGF